MQGAAPSDDPKRKEGHKRESLGPSANEGGLDTGTPPQVMAISETAQKTAVRRGRSQARNLVHKKDKGNPVHVRGQERGCVEILKSHPDSCSAAPWSNTFLHTAFKTTGNQPGPETLKTKKEKEEMGID